MRHRPPPTRGGVACPAPRCGSRLKGQPAGKRRETIWCCAPGLNARRDEQRAEGGKIEGGTSNKRPSRRQRHAAENGNGEMSTFAEPTSRNATEQVRGDSGTTGTDSGEEAAGPYDHPQKREVITREVCCSAWKFWALQVLINQSISEIKFVAHDMFTICLRYVCSLVRT
jgi:hypothetical protein